MTVYIATALDNQGRPMIDEALNFTTTDKAQAEATYEWLVNGGWDAKLIAVS